VKPTEPPRAKSEKSAAKVASSPDVTRSGNIVADLKLRDVQKIYIEIRGDDELRNSLYESLNSSGIVAATTNADEADAALKITVSQTGTSAMLVNARGTVLWSKTTKVASEIVKDLLSAIRLARAGP
jgi:hypothetical protein